jgi:hypothetical protein
MSTTHNTLPSNESMVTFWSNTLIDVWSIIFSSTQQNVMTLSSTTLLMTITMTEQSTGSFSIISVQNEINEMKKSFFMSVILLMITGHWDSRPKQVRTGSPSKHVEYSGTSTFRSSSTHNTKHSSRV